MRMFMHFRYRIALILGKVAFTLSRITRRGSGEQIQGRVIDALCPGALAHLAQGRTIIAVSATNGKTTTTRLIASALEHAHGSVITNALGANQRAGVVAALVQGRNNHSAHVVLEIDERSLPGMFDEIAPSLLVLGNLSRDQLDRFGEVSSIAHSWKKMLESHPTSVIANGCDPHIVYATRSIHPSPEYIDIASSWHDDAHTCPMCGSLLEWDKRSHFSCSACDMKTPECVQLSSQTRTAIEGALSLPGQWNISNAYIAYLACSSLSLSDDVIFEAWPYVREVSGRNATYQCGEHTVQLFLAKNPAGWNELLRYLNSNDSNIVFAFNCNIADGKDPSWLYDVDFESSPINNIVVFGERATDMMVRLEVAGKTVRRAHDIVDSISHFPPSHVNIVASYTQFLSLSRTLGSHHGTKVSTS